MENANSVFEELKEQLNEEELSLLNSAVASLELYAGSTNRYYAGGIVSALVASGRITVKQKLAISTELDKYFDMVLDPIREYKTKPGEIVYSDKVGWLQEIITESGHRGWIQTDTAKDADDEEEEDS